MHKLIITATVDCVNQYPNNPYAIPTEEVERVGQQYLDAISAGASIAHIHGVHTLESEIQPDGRRLSRIDFEGWRRLAGLIRDNSDAVLQFGIASARQEEKVRLMGLEPDMMSICCNAHDEYFQPDPRFPAYEINAVHPVAELAEYTQVARNHGVKLELESFHTGAFWNINRLVSQGLLEPPLWISLYLGWPGGVWTPPHPKALLYLLDFLPENANWNLSVMHPPTAWQLLSLAVSLGGNVRVGWEDNPYVRDGVFAENNWELVERMVRIAEGLGREIATPQEARDIIGLEN